MMVERECAGVCFVECWMEEKEATSEGARGFSICFGLCTSGRVLKAWVES